MEGLMFLLSGEERCLWIDISLGFLDLICRFLLKDEECLLVLKSGCVWWKLLCFFHSVHMLGQSFQINPVQDVNCDWPLGVNKKGSIAQFMGEYNLIG
jgi:hypothetical protein